MKTALIDGDIVAFRAAYKAERVFDFGDDIYSTVADLREARGHYDCMVSDILKGSGCTEFRMVFSDPSGRSFRHDIYEDYKKNRHSYSNRKPIIFKTLRDELIDGGAIFRANLEGDDVLGIMQTSAPNTVICTIDKDLKNIPGLHYNFDKDIHSSVSKEGAYKFFLTQVLAGDPTDGIPGITGVGHKTAEKILEKGGYSWATVVAAYEKAGMNEETALTMARLVRILDKDLYDPIKQTPKLWSPR